MAGIEEERIALQGDVQALRGVRTVLEEEIQAERELLNTVALATWDAIEALEGTVADLGAVRPPRRHNLVEMDITLERLRRAGEVCLPMARSYEDHCAKVA